MKYQPKSKTFEAFLEKLNTTLEPEFVDDGPYRADLPSVHVIGPPRSGTTLVVQLLAKSGLFGYPSNIMAMFWRAPTVGARIQQHLWKSTDQVSLESLAGRTSEPLDPHEFGYFWRHALGHERNEMRSTTGPIPAAELQIKLDQISSVFEAPTVYKNFLVPAHPDYFMRELERQRFVIIRRRLSHVAASLLSTRRRLHVSEDAWLGPAPADAVRTYTTPAHRVAHQVRSLHDQLLTSGLLDSTDALTLDYDDLCRNPRSAIARICDHTGVGASANALQALPHELRVRDPTLSISDRESQLLTSLVDGH